MGENPNSYIFYYPIRTLGQTQPIFFIPNPDLYLLNPLKRTGISKIFMNVRMKDGKLQKRRFRQLIRNAPEPEYIGGKFGFKPETGKQSDRAV